MEENVFVFSLPVFNSFQPNINNNDNNNDNNNNHLFGFHIQSTMVLLPNYTIKRKCILLKYILKNISKNRMR